MILEKCGIVGIAAKDKEVATSLYIGLRALQHRGQESAGIAVFGSKMNSHKGMGLVNEAFNKNILADLKGNIGVGHVRYSTTGPSLLQNAQPMIVSSAFGDIALAHNGDLVNTVSLRNNLQEKGWAFVTDTDTELIVRILANELIATKDIGVAIQNTISKIVGSYSLVLLIGNRLFAVRDRYGIKPLCIGKLQDAYIVCSESVAIDALQGEFVRDVQPGETVELTSTQINTLYTQKPCRAHCMFEWVYFARPDSIIDGRLVYEVREKIGALLAEEHPVSADVIIPIPDSGRTHALGFSKKAGIPYAEGLMVNRYIERTFIIPEQKDRELNVALKLNPIKRIVSGKKVVLVDDSIVRGTTTRKIVQMVRAAGAKEVHVRVGCPPIVAPCYLGIDMKTRDQFIATARSTAEIAKELTADSIGYLSLKGLTTAIGYGVEELCTGCITATYPIQIEGEKLRSEH